MAPTVDVPVYPISLKSLRFKEVRLIEVSPVSKFVAVSDVGASQAH